MHDKQTSKCEHRYAGGWIGAFEVEFKGSESLVHMLRGLQNKMRRFIGVYGCFVNCGGREGAVKQEVVLKPEFDDGRLPASLISMRVD